MKHIVTMGGGTGTFVVLSALKTLSDTSITAVVSSADDGGSTGRLRDAYGYLPAGDARQALVALAQDEGIMRDLFAYRFTKSDVAGHTLGNLFITALTDLLQGNANAIEEASRILRVRGRVLLSTLVPTVLEAHLAEGTLVSGEHAIEEQHTLATHIERVALKEDVSLNPVAAKAIEEADVIVLGPGDLYTSTIAAILPTGTKEAITSSSARLVYIVNLFTKHGQTQGYTASDFVREITKYAGRAPDDIFIHTAPSFSAEILAHYESEGEFPVVDDLPNAPHIHRLPLASSRLAARVEGDALPRSLVRHDSELLAHALRPLAV